VEIHNAPIAFARRLAHGVQDMAVSNAPQRDLPIHHPLAILG
jgi:hypothetical protein